MQHWASLKNTLILNNAFIVVYWRHWVKCCRIFQIVRNYLNVKLPSVCPIIFVILWTSKFVNNVLNLIQSHLVKSQPPLVAYLFMLRNIKLNEICGKISYHREDKLRLVLLKSVISVLHYLQNRRSNNVLTVAPRLFLFSSKKQTLIWESENERFILGKCSIIFTFVLSRKHFHIFFNILNRFW